MSEVKIGPDNPHFNALAHNWRESGWHFGAGDPEYWRFSDRLLVPGGRLLDVGIGGGSSSLYFALHGMKVTGIDTDSRKVRLVNDMSEQLAGAIPGFRMHALESDVIEHPLPEGKFDTVLVSHIIHMPSQDSVYKMLDKSLDALKPGGHIWVRAAGKHSSEYVDKMISEGYSDQYGPVEYDDDNNVIWSYCGCSGENRYEPTVYFDPLDLMNYFTSRAVPVTYSQTISTEGKMNIMFGEDFNPEMVVPSGGMVTFMAQKPPS